MRKGKNYPFWERVRRLSQIFWRVAALALTILGLSGAPDDLAKWQEWLDVIVQDPRVTVMAEQAVKIAEFVNQWWVRGLLVLLPVALLLWNWRRFWNLRRRIIFRFNAMVKEKVWIDEKAAFALIRKSDWFNARRPAVTVSILELSGFGGLSKKIVDPEAIKLSGFINLVLKKFAENYPESAKQTEGKIREFDEGALLTYLDRSFEDDIQKTFGRIPD